MALEKIITNKLWLALADKCFQSCRCGVAVSIIMTRPRHARIVRQLQQIGGFCTNPFSNYGLLKREREKYYRGNR